MQETRAHQSILNYLNICAKNETLAHAYALIGANNVGRMQTLEQFLSAFIAPSISDMRACPDINIIHPHPEKNAISIDAIRQARSWLSLSPISSDKKALIITQADTMNTQAQNAFLKFLEEPAKNTYIFLIINHKDQILPTIYSRVQALYFSGSVQQNNIEDNIALQNILNTNDISERMRIWTQEKIHKDGIHDWLKHAVPALRARVINTKSKQVASSTRDLLEKLAHPKSQNWQLVAENLIISI